MRAESWGGCGHFLKQDESEVCLNKGLFLYLEQLEATVRLLTGLIAIGLCLRE